MSINLELYRTFYTTAIYGSISKAASALFTSQPAVSQAIKQLEAQLGGQLFYRNSKGVTLTKEGESLFHYIEQGYRLMMTAERKFAELKQLSAGCLRIAVCSAVCKYELLESISQYHKKYPSVQIAIRDASSSEISRLLDFGEIDIGVLNAQILDTNMLTMIKNITTQDCFVAGPKFKHLAKTVISIRDLAENYPLIMLQKGGATRTYIEEFFQAHQVELSPKIELSNLELMIGFAIRNLGIACVVKDYVQKELCDNQLIEIRIAETLPPRHLAVAIKSGMPMSTATQKFIEILPKSFVPVL